MKPWIERVVEAAETGVLHVSMQEYNEIQTLAMTNDRALSRHGPYDIDFGGTAVPWVGWTVVVDREPSP